MFTTLEDRALALEAKLHVLGEQIIEKHGIGSGDNDIAPLAEVGVPGHDKGCYIGRICNEVSTNPDFAMRMLFRYEKTKVALTPTNHLLLLGTPRENESYIGCD
jgi:hypothetical protein